MNRILIISSFLLPLVLVAQEESQLINAANDAYQNQAYEEAIQQYQTLIDQGYQSSTLFYNLGNAYFKSGQMGKAVLYYEKAKVLAPFDADIRHNLKVVDAQLEDNIEPLAPFFLIRWWNFWVNAFSPTTWSIIGIVCLWLGVAGLAIWLLGKERRRKKLGFFIGVGLLIGSLFPFALAYSGNQRMQNNGLAVIMEQEIGLKTAPDDQSQDLFRLHEGTKVQILDQIGTWYKVKLADGEIGWLLASQLERV